MIGFPHEFVEEEPRTGAEPPEGAGIFWCFESPCYSGAFPNDRARYFGIEIDNDWKIVEF